MNSHDSNPGRQRPRSRTRGAIAQILALAAAAGIRLPTYRSPQLNGSGRQRRRADKAGTAKPAFSCGYRGMPRVRPAKQWRDLE